MPFTLLADDDIDLSRPKISNADGSFSTERTITIEADGKHLLIPTIVGGKQRSESEAIALWKSGQNKAVGSYGSADEAERSAVERSARIGRVRGNEEISAPKGGFVLLAEEAKPKGKDSLGLGYVGDVAMGARQAWDAGAQMLARGVESVIPAVRGSREELERSNKQNWENNQALTAPESRGIGADIARGTGQAMMVPAPAIKAASMLKALFSGAMIGAEGGAATPVYEPGDDFAAQKAKQVGTGAAAGAVVGGGVNALGKVLDPAIGAGQKLLQKAGIDLTPGQAMGGILKSVEDKLTSVPIIGDLINSRRFNGIADFNRAVYAKAVEPFGAEGAAIVKNADPGSAGIKKVGDFLSSKYEDALARSVPNVIDDGFQRGMSQVASMVPGALKQDFVEAVQRSILTKITPGGTLTPSVAKEAESELGRLAASYRGSAQAGERELGRALGQAQAELRDLVARNNPEIAPLIQAANQGWRTLVQMENAGAMLGAKDGIFTPAQFLNAVKKSDKSPRDRQFARGDAYNQEFAEAADRILPNKIADSGTAGRFMTGAAMGGGLGLLEPVSATAAAGVGAAYLPGVNQLITKLLSSERPEAVKLAAELARMLAPQLEAAGGAVATNR